MTKIIDYYVQDTRLSAVFSEAQDVTDALRATDIAKYIDPKALDFLNVSGNPIEYMLGDNYHPGWLEAINDAAGGWSGVTNPDASDLIDPNGDMQLVYAIDLDSGLLNSLEQWWGVGKAGNILEDANDLINRWQYLPIGGYEHPGQIMSPTGAILVTSDGEAPNIDNPLQTMLVSTTSHTGRGVEYPLLGLDINDETGVRDFLKSLTDPSITRETHIAHEIQRQQQKEQQQSQKPNRRNHQAR